MPNDWSNIKFLESATNIREVIRKSTGRQPNASTSREIAVCIQQGRLFFEAANIAPIQIKPLEIYYGVVAFSQAVIIARSGKSIASMKPSHGLADISAPDAKLENLKLRVARSGTFQAFNDAIFPLGRICYIDEYAMPRSYRKPFDSTNSLGGHDIKLIDILARIPKISGEFERTFSLPSKVMHISLTFNYSRCELRIDDPVLFSDRASLADLIKNLRSRCPFLKEWSFSTAEKAWGNSIIIFENIADKIVDDIMSDEVEEINNSFLIKKAFPIDVRPRRLPFDMLPALSGGYTGRSLTYAIEPLNNVLLNEYSLQFLGCFLLSTLVRYRPQIWQHATSRSFTEQRPADDYTLSIIESFMDHVLQEFPNMVESLMEYKIET